MTKKESEDKGRSLSEHFKLVSEGGGKKAESPGVQCWSVDQLVADCITPQQMENFRSYNNVCMTLPTNDKYVFSLPLKHIPDLDLESIPEDMQQEFENCGLPLSERASLIAQNRGRVWFIVDGKKKYSVRMVPTGLLVYSEML